jgi:hypothetical protein
MPAMTRGQMLIDLMKQKGKIAKMKNDYAKKMNDAKKKLAKMQVKNKKLIAKEQAKKQLAGISQSTLRRWARDDRYQ